MQGDQIATWLNKARQQHIPKLQIVKKVFKLVRVAEAQMRKG
jgi:hypothetical protein